MGRKFICFLGIGALNSGKGAAGYNIVSYVLPGGSASIPTSFAQVAILKEEQPLRPFDNIVLFMTKESKEKHFEMLVGELERECGIGREKIVGLDCLSTENQNESAQWEWFARLLDIIKEGDEVVFDFTHGFRSVPIIFATAINFLQTVRRFRLERAYYGFLETGKPQPGEAARGRIIDMANFFRINRWADAASRLVDTADASLLADLADEGREGIFMALGDQALIESLRDLTSIIKNVDVNHVAATAGKALGIVRDKLMKSSGAEACLLRMVSDKFGELGTVAPPSGKYDSAYFEVQLILSEMLIRHGFLMQAFTVMRELVGSIGMAGLKGKYADKRMDSCDGRKHRRRFSEIFINMCQMPEEKWSYRDPAESACMKPEVLVDFSMIQPFYTELKSKGIADSLSTTAKSIVDLRNGFDHAWTSKAGVPSDVHNEAVRLLADLRLLLKTMKSQGIIA